jgi:hypothetical protein
VILPRRIRLSRAKGWRLPDNAVNCARPGRWGNPFVVGKHGTRAQCVAMFWTLEQGFIAFSHDDPTVEQQLTLHRRIRRHVHELAGKDLACWCALDGEPCHADVLLLRANPDLYDQLRPAWMDQPITLPRIRLGMTASTLDRLNRKKKRQERAAAAIAAEVEAATAAAEAGG